MKITTFEFVTRFIGGLIIGELIWQGSLCIYDLRRKRIKVKTNGSS